MKNNTKSVFGIKEDMIYRIVRDSAKAIGINDISPHDGRRYYAKSARKGGAPLEQIQKTLGHQSIRTTQIYLNSDLEIEQGKAAGDYIASPL